MPLPRRPVAGFLASLSLALALDACAAPPPSDVAIILGRATDEARHLPEAQARPDQITAWVAALTPGGIWPDIDYRSQAQGAWKPGEHIGRLLRLAAYNTSGNPFPHQADIKRAALRAYDGWFTALPAGTPNAKAQTRIKDTHTTPTSTNWWHNDIGVQLAFGPALLLLLPDLSLAQRQVGEDILFRSWIPDEHAQTNQGANLSWRSRITTWYACLRNDAPLLREIVRRMGAETFVTQSEGLQPDFSFWQHGPQLYSLGYGVGFALDVTALATLYHQTAFAFPPVILDNIAHLMLDGQQWMMRGDTLDKSARGREIARQGSGRSQRLRLACDRMAALGAARAGEFRAFAAHIEGRPGAAPLEGNRAFWRSDLMTHQRPGFYASTRTTTARLHAAERMNGEGLRSYYTGDGVSFLLQNGGEYDDIEPVWDWTRLPGVTCPHAAAPPPLSGSYNQGVGDFAGGASDGRYGATVYDYARDGVTARKAWFYFDREYVCLGAGIAAAATVADPVITSVNQCWQQGAVVLQAAVGAPTTLPTVSQRLLAAPRWLHHDRVGYVFPTDNPAVVVKAGQQSGKWTDITTDAPDKRTVTGDVFSVWLDHEHQPAGTRYAYVVVPGIAPGDMAPYAADLPVRIIANTPSAQAVWHRSLRLLQAGFYEAGAVSVPGKWSVEVSRPCVVLVREVGPGQVAVSVANPQHTPLRGPENTPTPLIITLTLTRPGKTPVLTTFALPGGGYAGQTVTKTVSLV